MGHFDWTKYQESTGGFYVNFKEVGDEVVGRIMEIRAGTDFNRNLVPELVLDVGNGESKVLTASQAMLRAAIAEKAPQEGDRIRIRYTGNGEARPGRNAPKLFTVDVKPGEPTNLDDDAPF